MLDYSKIMKAVDSWRNLVPPGTIGLTVEAEFDYARRCLDITLRLDGVSVDTQVISKADIFTCQSTAEELVRSKIQIMLNKVNLIDLAIICEADDARPKASQRS